LGLGEIWSAGLPIPTSLFEKYAFMIALLDFLFCRSRPSPSNNQQRRFESVMGLILQIYAVQKTKSLLGILDGKNGLYSIFYNFTYLTSLDYLMSGVLFNIYISFKIVMRKVAKMFTCKF
jgi:hypothetical protein